MAKIDLTSREWCELVFEGKNKAYGAYEMRQTSPSRHNKATIIVMIFVLIAFSLPALLKIVVPKQEKEVMTEVTELTSKLRKKRPKRSRNRIFLLLLPSKAPSSSPRR